MNTRKANHSDHEILFTAKSYWNYRDEYFEVWKSELTITEDYITDNAVYIAEINKVQLVIIH